MTIDHLAEKIEAYRKSYAIAREADERAARVWRWLHTFLLFLILGFLVYK